MTLDLYTLPIDQYNDPGNRMGFSHTLISERFRSTDYLTDVVNGKKQYAAYIVGKGTSKGIYRIDNPIDALTSAWYFVQNVKYFPEDIAVQIAAKIYDALVSFGINSDDADYVKALSELASKAGATVPEGPVTVPNEVTVPDTEKTAERLTMRERMKLPKKEFGLVYKDPVTGKTVKKYPLHDKEHVMAAIRFFNMHYDRLPEEFRAKVAKKIKQKASQYGIMISPDNVIHKYASLFEKTAKELTMRERMKLPKKVFGLVYKDPRTGKVVKKYPLHDEAHVKAAISFFNMHYDKVPEKYRASLARKIKQKAKQYGIQISPDNALNKYASLEEGKLNPDFYKYIALREKYAPAEYKPVYEKIASVAEDYPPHLVAKVLERLDKDAGVDRYWKVVGTPLDAVTTPMKPLEKQASDSKPKFFKTNTEEVLRFVEKNMNELLNKMR